MRLGKARKTSWNKRPLFRRKEDLAKGGHDGYFRTGAEAADMLYAEAKRHDPHDTVFLETAKDVLDALAPVIDRWPKYAWVAKQLLEAERALSFRVAWLDDKGISRVNRGYRYQYSSALGPFVGPLHFSKDLTAADVKAHAFDLVLSNSLSGLKVGASVGGADFNVHDKSEAEIQRFCQAFMSAMTKHIGTEIDFPSMGSCVGGPEIGYLYGQVALYAAEKLLELGAIPVTFSDSSGHIFEPEGFDDQKFQQVLKIKQERGARVGRRVLRYIVASPTAKYNEPPSIFEAPCDVVFLCSKPNELSAESAAVIANSGCKTVVDGGYRPVSSAASEVLKKKGVFHVPYRGTMIGAALGGGREINRNPLRPGETMDERLEKKMDEVYEVSASVAREFNMQGDLERGCTIAGFLRVGRAMMAHGAV
eukprot:jgi/Undpi1/14230/HiC_scaffold_9.g03879.m1